MKHWSIDELSEASLLRSEFLVIEEFQKLDLMVGWPYVPFLGLGPGVPPSLPLCPGIFDSKFAFVNTVC